MFGSKVLAIFAFVIFMTVSGSAAGGDGVWQRVGTDRVSSRAKNAQRRPTSFAAFSLDRSALKRSLTHAPEEFTSKRETIVTIPLPDGTLGRFRVEHSLIVEPGLLDKFPELGSTYRGYGIDDPTAYLRFDMMSSGFHAMILRAGTTYFVDPSGTDGVYLAYEKTALPPPDQPFVCDTNNDDTNIAEMLMTTDTSANAAQVAEPPEVSNGGTLRTYRLALAADWEYCNAVAGGSTSACLAAQVVTMNRVNGVYERDLSIHMNIVANNNLIVFATDNTTACGGVQCTTNNDGYTNNTGSTMLGENQTKLNAVIGTANYDIGHVFSTGGGGVASQSPCSSSSKARGVTGSPSPTGDGFDIDYVAHEMGHQYGAAHTFNGTTGSCGGGNRSSSAAEEPGSGITVMAYAGICGAEDLAIHSIDTFAVKSLEQIVASTNTGAASSCAAQTATGNTPPTVSPGAAYTVPAQTPFSLTASATDVNGDAVTYDWQEYDFGPLAPPNTDSDGSARPIFRDYNPTTSGRRYFPSLNYILNNANVPPATYDCGGRVTPCLTGEIMSSLTRTMTFQVVVRDNRAGGGGINTATSTVAVSTLSGPFQVTAPNTAVSVTGGSSLNVTWAVNDTNLAPVSAANVDILLSTDGGQTFPITLLGVTPNDGSQAVTIPNISTTNARIKVQGSAKIFFDISDANFTITASSVTVTGRVLTVDGRGVKGGQVTLADPNGGNTTVQTGRNGSFSFTNVTPGRTYTISAQSRRFTYAPQVVAVNDNVTGLVFQPN